MFTNPQHWRQIGVGTLIAVLFLIGFSTTNARTDYPDEVAPCDSTPLDWCSWVTAVICQTISTNFCDTSDPKDQSSVTWPSDLSNGTFANTYYYYDDTDSTQLDNGSGSITFMIASYHDSCASYYKVADFQYDGSNLDFSSWSIDTQHDSWTATQMASQTESDVFTMSTGKKLSFYREFSWADPSTGEQTQSNYLSLDTLSYTIELIKDSDDSRLEVLDTMSVLRRTTRGTPTLSGTYPILAAIEYTIPAGYNGIDAYIRVVPLARGTSSYKFARYDHIGWQLSDKPNTSEGSAYITSYGAGMPKAIPTWNQLASEHLSSTHLAPLHIGENRTGLFELTGDNLNGEPIRIILVNAAGQTWNDQSSVLYSSGQSVGIEVRFPSSGAFFVVAYRNATPLAVSKTMVK